MRLTFSWSVFKFWEEIKTSYGGGVIEVPLGFISNYMETSQHHIRFTPVEAQAIFDAAIDPVIREVREQFSNQFQHIYLTGGMSRNLYFQKKMLKAFDPAIHQSLDNMPYLQSDDMQDIMSGIVRLTQDPDKAVCM